MVSMRVDLFCEREDHTRFLWTLITVSDPNNCYLSLYNYAQRA
jgi:hypothetical protein